MNLHILMLVCLVAIGCASDAQQVAPGGSFPVTVATTRQVRITNASVTGIMPTSFAWGRASAYGNTIVIMVNQPDDEEAPAGGGEFAISTTMGSISMGVSLATTAPDIVLNVTIVPADTGSGGGSNDDRVDGPKGSATPSVLRSQAAQLDREADGVSTASATAVVERAAAYFANYRQVSSQEWWRPYSGLTGASPHPCAFPPRKASPEELSMSGAAELRRSSVWTFLSAMYIFGDQARQLTQDCLRTSVPNGLLSQCAQAAAGEPFPQGTATVLANVCLLPHDPEAKRRIEGQVERSVENRSVLQRMNRQAWAGTHAILRDAFTTATQFPEVDKKPNVPAALRGGLRVA